jgi:hypothetical protein
MVCLSKHTHDIKICLICGSANSDSINKTQIQITMSSMSKSVYEAKNKALFNEMSAYNVHAGSPLRALNNMGPNGLKTWKCGECNFANDNLKIVCMNCRASKQQSSARGITTRITHQTVQSKRKSTLAINRQRHNRSNEENENTSDNEVDHHRKGIKRKKNKQILF